jgi:hypothetical protein
VLGRRISCTDKPLTPINATRIRRTVRLTLKTINHLGKWAIRFSTWHKDNGVSALHIVTISFQMHPGTF